MGYSLLLHLHLGTAYITLILFLLRGFWMLSDSPRLQGRWLKVVPHLNDILLLAAAIAVFSYIVAVAITKQVVPRIGNPTRF